MQRIDVLWAAAALVALGLAGGCSSSSELRRASDQIQRDHNVLLAISARLDELSQRTIALSEGQSALEVRAATLERVSSESERAARATSERVEQLARVRNELADLRKQLTALQGESDFERATAARLTQLELDVSEWTEGDRRNAAQQPRSIDAIWRRYLDQRDHITELDANLRVATPRP